MNLPLACAAALSLALSAACVGEPDELDEIEDDASLGDVVDSGFEEAAAQACTYSYGGDNPLGTARVQINYVQAFGITRVQDVIYDFSNRDHLAGGNNKVGVDVQVAIDGRWRDAAGNGDYDLWYNGLPLGGDTFRPNRDVTTGARPVRLKVRVSWDVSLSSDPASTCYMRLS